MEPRHSSRICLFFPNPWDWWACQPCLIRLIPSLVRRNWVLWYSGIFEILGFFKKKGERHREYSYHPTNFPHSPHKQFWAVSLETFRTCPWTVAHSPAHIPGWSVVRVLLQRWFAELCHLTSSSPPPHSLLSHAQMCRSISWSLTLNRKLSNLFYC